jgi:hypothetical protein
VPDEDSDAMTVLYRIDDDVTWSIRPTALAMTVVVAERFRERVLRQNHNRWTLSLLTNLFSVLPSDARVIGMS